MNTDRLNEIRNHVASHLSQSQRVVPTTMAQEPIDYIDALNRQRFELAEVLARVVQIADNPPHHVPIATWLDVKAALANLRRETNGLD